jgi:hypothetical protein
MDSKHQQYLAAQVVSESQVVGKQYNVTDSQLTDSQVTYRSFSRAMKISVTQAKESVDIFRAFGLKISR